MPDVLDMPDVSKVPYAADELASKGPCSPELVLLDKLDDVNLVMIVGFSS